MKRVARIVHVLAGGLFLASAGTTAHGAEPAA
jgi:hypothetical protein